MQNLNSYEKLLSIYFIQKKGGCAKMINKIKELSKTLVNYSLHLEKNERVLIKTESIQTKPLIKELVREVTNAGAIPVVRYLDLDTEDLLLERTTEQRIQLLKEMNEFDVEHFDAFISIHYIENDYNGIRIPKEVRKAMGSALEPSNNIRINERKWVLLNYPSKTAAHKAGMPTEEFYQFSFDVMTVDYHKMDQMIQPLKELMEKTDKVRIVAPNTDISFSIKGIPAIPCTGSCNIPDGEIYTAPVRDSVNGTITYNTPCPYHGSVYTGVSLTFEDGKIIKATCNEDDEALNHIFDTDAGARYIGEFALGFNPKILKPMGDILFDEKILGSLHFTPGRAYEDASNGNVSSIHWDMVLIQRQEYGGGEIYFDDKLIRKDGNFVLPELQPLNFN